MQESAITGESETSAVSPGSQTNESNSEEDEFANDAQLVAEFRKFIAEKVAAGIHVKCQDNSVVITQVNPDLPPRYHTTVTMQFEFKLPPVRVVNLSIDDSNFSA